MASKAFRNRDDPQTEAYATNRRSVSMRRQARVPKTILNEGRINTRVTPKAFELLMEEVNKRSCTEPRLCTTGTVLDELIIKCLSHAAEVPEPIPEPMPVKPVAVKRGPGRPRRIPRDEAQSA